MDTITNNTIGPNRAQIIFRVRPTILEIISNASKKQSLSRKAHHIHFILKSDIYMYISIKGMKTPEQEPLKRSEEITQSYFQFLDRHIAEVVSGKLLDFMEINEIASQLFVSHKHLTDTVQKETGNHPCYFYDLKIIEQAKRMLIESDSSVAEVAKILTYDPSNFSKFFKKFVGQTPGLFQKENKSSGKFTTK
jgi:AraC-like DNA-binding protein